MKTISFLYLNHRGEVATRRVQPEGIEWLPNPGYGYEPGWFLRGFDMDRAAIRSFRLSHIQRGHDTELFILKFQEGRDSEVPEGTTYDPS